MTVSVAQGRARLFPRGDRFAGLPWWLVVSLLFLAGRLVSTVMLLWFAAHQDANPWTGAHPSLWDFSSIWDGRWYNIIAEVGYPSTLPHDPNGHVIENAWAFLPLYPLTVKAIMMATGASWNAAAISVSVVCSAGATFVFFALMRAVMGVSQSVFATLLFSLSPVGAIYQVAYAESMQILLMAAALLLLVKHRYLSIIPVVLLLGVTRPGAPALALTLALHFLYRMWGARGAAFTAGDRVRILVAFVFAVFASFEWMLIAWWRTGVPNAYLQTELAWRSPYVGWHILTPFTPWIEATQWWFPGIGGWLLLALFLGMLVALLANPLRKRIGVDLQFWNVSYTLYLLAVFFPQSSTFRILGPLFPVFGMFAAPRSRIYRVLIVLACLVLQWFWISYMWAVGGYDWTPP